MEDNNQLRKTYPTPEFINTSDTKPRGIQPKYPWSTIKLNESFQVNYNEMKKTSLVPYLSRMGKKHKKKFRLTDCPEYNCYIVSCYEVTCLPKDDEEVIPSEIKSSALPWHEKKKEGE